jgi:EamA domain-containing membrane protein RarD
MIVKPGFKTTEMLVTVLASVGAWLAEWQGSLQPKWAALATTVSAAAYALSRAITKHGAATGGAAKV